MAKDKNSPKKTAAIFNAMTKAMVTVKPKPKKDIQTKEKKKYVLINILKNGEIIFPPLQVYKASEEENWIVLTERTAQLTQEMCANIFARKTEPFEMKEARLGDTDGLKKFSKLKLRKDYSLVIMK